MEKCTQCQCELDSIEELKMNGELYQDEDGNIACEQCAWNQ